MKATVFGQKEMVHLTLVAIIVKGKKKEENYCRENRIAWNEKKHAYIKLSQHKITVPVLLV